MREGQPIKNIKTYKEQMNNHTETETVHISMSRATLNCQNAEILINFY